MLKNSLSRGERQPSFNTLYSCNTFIFEALVQANGMTYISGLTIFLWFEKKYVTQMLT